MKKPEKILQNDEVLVDLTMIYDICEDDEGCILKMVKVFSDSINPTVESFKHHFVNEDWENLFKAAHKAKSSLSIVKVLDLYDWVITVEQRSRLKKDLETIGELIEKIEKKYSQANSILNLSFKTI